MEKKVRFVFLLIVFLNAPIVTFGQFTSEHPPEPTMASTSQVPGSDCVKDTTGSGPSVPVGLCLPINDYLFPLFLSGVALGAIALFQLQKKQEIRNSAV